MKKYCAIAFIFLFFMTISVYCTDIVILPINYYEKAGNNFARKTYDKDIAEDIGETLNRYYNVKYDKEIPGDSLTGATDSDAVRVSRLRAIDYVLYGALKKDEAVLSIDLKLYNARTETYELFFASDAAGQYRRLIQNVCNKILEYFHTEVDKIDALQFEVNLLNQQMEELKRNADKAGTGQPAGSNVEKEFALRLPVQLGTWSYTEREWVDLVQGTGAISVGIDIFPKLQLPSQSGINHEFSFGLLAGYRNGITAKQRTVQNKVLLNTILINPFVKYHLKFYSNNWVSLGVGAVWDIGIWHIEEIEWETIFEYTQVLTGISSSLAYSYQFNRRFALDAGANVYFYFTKNSSIAINPYVGLTITFLGGYIYEVE